jgi:hypothetical protein
MPVKRVLLVVGALVVVGGLGLALLARRVFTGANVRAAIEGQISQALGQPVSIGGIGASAWPRVTMDLTDVAIGRPARIQLAKVHVGTGVRALFSRRIEHADVRVEGARLTLPLLSLAPVRTTSTPGAGAAKPPLEIVSIDEIVLKDVAVVSGPRTLHGDIELVPYTAGVQIRRVALDAEGTAIAITGSLTSLAPIAGGVDIAAEALDVDRFLAFVNEFMAASMTPAASPTATANASPIDELTVGLKVGRATTAGLTLSGFAATAVVSPNLIAFERLTFGVLGGSYDGTMSLAFGDRPRFQWEAKISGVDTARLMAFAGSPDTITGALSGEMSLAGDGLVMEPALRSARGKVRVDIVNGTIAGLQLLRTIVTATSGRGGIAASAGAAAVASREASGAERFSRLGATLHFSSGAIETSDLAMASADVDLAAGGTLRLPGLATALTGRAVLSEALSRQAGTDLYRYAQEGGRVVLPITVTGPIDHLAVRVDLAGLATRAIRNRLTDEADKALERHLPGLDGLLSRRPPR